MRQSAAKVMLRAGRQLYAGRRVFGFMELQQLAVGCQSARKKRWASQQAYLTSVMVGGVPSAMKGSVAGLPLLPTMSTAYTAASQGDDQQDVMRG